MANNAAVNKVVFNGDTVIDLTSDTVSPDTLYKGTTAHDASGEPIVGTMEGGGGELDTEAIYEHLGKVGAKNLLGITASDIMQAATEVDVTVDEDAGTVFIAGGVTINTTQFLPLNAITYEAGNGYILSGCPEGGSPSTYCIKSDYAKTFVDTGDSVTIIFTSNTDAIPYICLYAGLTVPSEGLTFKPMIRYAEDTDETFRPRAKTNKQLTDDIETLTGEVEEVSDELSEFNTTLANADAQLRLIYAANGGNPVDENQGSGLVPRFSDLQKLERRKSGFAQITSIESPAANALRFNMTYEKANQPSEWVEAGILATNRTSVGLNMTVPYIDSLTPSGDVSYFHRYADISTIKTENPHTFSWNWTKGNTTDVLWYVRAYYIYKDPEGNKHTVYGQTTGGILDSTNGARVEDLENAAGPCEVIEWAEIESLKSGVSAASTLAGNAMSTASTASARATASETWEHNTKTGVHNLLEIPTVSDAQTFDYQGQTYSIYFTKDDDEYISSNLDSSIPDSRTFNYESAQYKTTLPAGDYIITIESNSPDTTDVANARVMDSNDNALNAQGFYPLKDVTFKQSTMTLTEETDIGVMIKTGDGKYRIMLRYAEDTDSTFAPYADTNLSLTRGVSDIKSADYGAGVNLLEITAESQTVNGVTFTVDKAAGTVTANGTATAEINPYNVGYFNGNGSFIASVQNRTGIADFFINTADGAKTFTKSGVEFANDGTECSFGIYVANGGTLDNFVFKPMIRPAEITDPTFYPHIPTNKELGEDSTETKAQLDGYFGSEAEEADYEITGMTSMYGFILISNGTQLKGNQYLGAILNAPEDITYGNQTLPAGAYKVVKLGYNDYVIAANTGGTVPDSTYIEPVTLTPRKILAEDVFVLIQDVAVLSENAKKNLLEITAESQTVNGVTYTIDKAAGTITLNGTADGQSLLIFGEAKIESGKEYMATDGFSDNTWGTYTLQILNRNLSNAEYIKDEEALVMHDDTLCYFRLALWSGQSFSNKVIKPMLRPVGTSPDFVPYMRSNLELTHDTDGVRGVGRNLIDYSDKPGLFEYGYAISANITYTLDPNTKTLTANGTATSTSQVYSRYYTVDEIGTRDVIISGASGGSTSTYYVFLLADNSAKDEFYCYDGDLKVTIPSNAKGFWFYCRCINGYTASNLVFKPMVRLAKYADDPTYYPHSMDAIDYQRQTNALLEDNACKNLLDLPDSTSATNYNVSSGMVSIKSVPSSNTSVNLGSITLSLGLYTLNGTTDSTKAYIYIKLSDSSSPADYGQGVDFTVTTAGTYNVNAVITTAATTGHQLRPMIRKAEIKDPTFQPHFPSVKEIWEGLLQVKDISSTVTYNTTYCDEAKVFLRPGQLMGRISFVASSAKGYETFCYIPFPTGYSGVVHEIGGAIFAADGSTQNAYYANKYNNRIEFGFRTSKNIGVGWLYFIMWIY